MPDRRPACAGKMGLAADVGGGDALGPPRLQRPELAPAQLARKRRLQQRVGARRAAAQVRVVDRRQIESRARQDRLDPAADLLAVLQGAGRLEGDAARLPERGQALGLDDLREVAGQRALPTVRGSVTC